MNKFDTAQFYASLPSKLREAQTLLEQSVEAFGMAVDVEAEALRKYRETKTISLSSALAEGIKPTNVNEYTRGMPKVAKSKEEYLKAKGKKEKCRFLIEAYRERIFNIRHLGRDMEILTKQG